MREGSGRRVVADLGWVVAGAWLVVVVAVVVVVVVCVCVCVGGGGGGAGAAALGCMAAVILAAEDLLSASTITIISIRLSFVGKLVDCKMKTSFPRTFSRSSSIVSPSLKLPTVASPSFRPKLEATFFARSLLAFPVKTIRFSFFTNTPVFLKIGWGGRIRTFACMDQNHVP